MKKKNGHACDHCGAPLTQAETDTLAASEQEHGPLPLWLCNQCSEHRAWLEFEKVEGR